MQNNTDDLYHEMRQKTSTAPEKHGFLHPKPEHFEGEKHLWV